MFWPRANVDDVMLMVANVDSQILVFTVAQQGLRLDNTFQSPFAWAVRIQTMGDLGATYGFYGEDPGMGGAGEAVTLVDKTGEAWVFHICGGGSKGRTWKNCCFLKNLGTRKLSDDLV